MARARKGGTGPGKEAPEVQPEPEEPAADQPEATPQSDESPADTEAPMPEVVPREELGVASVQRPAAGREPDPAPAAPRRSGFLGTVLGGAVAAGMGFGAATYIVPRLSPPAVSAADVEAVKRSISEQAARLDTVDKAMDEIGADTTVKSLADAQAALSGEFEAGLSGLRKLLAGIDTRLSDTGARLAGYEDRIAALEKRPVDGGAASATALEAFGRDMEAFRAEMADQRAAFADAQRQVESSASAATESITSATAEAELIRTEAQQASRAATTRAALSHIEAALTSGGALGPALADLSNAGVEVPAALADQAQGVPTMQSLRDAFAPAAREALAVSLRQTADGTTWDRLTAFLRVQSGARSLAPKAGTDPDAVLSRAEAALGAGDLAAAIGEIGSLPADGQARLAEWVDLAGRRIAATEAVRALKTAQE